MICFRDMTFCKFYVDCKKADKCPRPLSPQVKKSAELAWPVEGESFPIAEYTDVPNCYDGYIAYEVFKDTYNLKDPYVVKLPVGLINFKKKSNAITYSNQMYEIQRKKNGSETVKCYTKE